MYADELRKQMVSQLFIEDMSPTQLHERFGGGSVTRVDQHVQVLAGSGWTALVEKKSGGRRRGGVEHFYRATEMAAIDTPTWSRLPYSIRATMSRENFRELAALIRNALLAGTFDARADRHLSWTPLMLDRCGWRRVIAAVDALFESLWKEQLAARQRLAESGEDSIPMIVGLMGFESAGSSQSPKVEWVGPDLVACGESSVPCYPRVSKLIENEIRLIVVDELNLRDMSIPQFHREFGDELGLSRHSIRGHFKKLTEYGWLTKVGMTREEGRRGPPEHLYRATKPVILENETWAEVPDSVKATQSWRTFNNLAKHVGLAMEAGTLDARTDAHKTWSPLRLDRQGWERVIAKVDAVFHLLPKEQKAAKARLAKSGEDPIPMIVALAAFESAKDTEKQP